MLNGAAIELGSPARDVQLGLIGDVPDGARLRAGTEEGPLRTAQHLHAIRIEQVDIRREQRKGDHRLVEVDADLLLDARLVAHDLAGRQAADGDLALARSEVLNGEPAHVRRDAFEVFDAAATQHLRGRCGDRKGHVDQL